MKLKKPPNLHVTHGKDRCANCAWYHAQGGNAASGSCAMFGGYHVSAVEVCDSYEKGKPGTKG